MCVSGEIMDEFKYPNLFKPIVLGRTMFKNRIFASPTGYMAQDRFGILPVEAVSYYERKAMGGAASVAIGECKVDAKFGSQSTRSVHMDDPFARSVLCQVTEAVRRQGAVCTAELSHCGLYANSVIDPPGPAFGPVAGVADGLPYSEMTEEQIWYTIDKYAKAAAFAKECGFGMVMVHGGHGWLLSQFLSPALNTRTDKWGGASVENRARLAVEILKAVRKAVGPGFPIEFRMSGSECFDGGYDIEEGIKIAKQIEDYVDLLHVSVGSHQNRDAFTITHPSLFLPDGCNVQFAEAIKKNVKCAVATVGALADPDLMEEIIATGKADVVELARGLLADPDLPKKARTGKDAEINTCMRCLNCFSALHKTGQFSCAINPKTGHEAEMKYAIPATEKKKVLIAGGGVAGMQAALTCVERGHEVILCEKTDRLGGTLNCEENVPFKQKLSAYLSRQAKLVEQSGVEIRLNTEVNADYVKQSGADVVIAALGARPIKVPIPGIDGENVKSAEEVYYNPEKAGENVVILGAGLVGVELAIYLSMLGRKVTVVEMLGEMNTGGNHMHGWALELEIKKYGIDMHFNTAASEITPEGVRCKGKDGEEFYKADTVIYATGQRSLWDVAESLACTAPDFHMIGDCAAPKNIMNATSVAFAVARNI